MSVTSAVRRHFIYALLVLTLFSFQKPLAWATIAIPTDLRTMVRKADLVFTGKVLRQRAEWANLNGRKTIITFVSFEVIEAYKGSAEQKLELRCPGGTIGDTTLELTGMPTFSNGERCVLFVRTNANVVCPIVGIYHGKLLIEKTGCAEQTLMQHNGRPLNNISEIGRDHHGPLAASTVGRHDAPAGNQRRVTVSELKARIREEVAALAQEGK